MVAEYKATEIKLLYNRFAILLLTVCPVYDPTTSNTLLLIHTINIVPSIITRILNLVNKILCTEKYSLGAVNTPSPTACLIMW